MGRSDAQITADDPPETDGISLPDWIFTPRAWLATVLIGWVLDIWEKLLGYIDSVWSFLATIPDIAVYQPIVGAFGPIGFAIQAIWKGIGDIAIDVSEPAGPLAPLVVVAVWIIPMMMAIGGLYVLIGFLGTYLPLRSIPGLRRLA